MNIMEQVEAKENPIPLKNEGLGELKCRRHFFMIIQNWRVYGKDNTIPKAVGGYTVNAKVVKVGADFVVAEQNGKEITLKADSVVNAMGRRAHDITELKDSIDVPVWVVGDSLKARQIGDSIREAWTAAMEIV